MSVADLPPLSPSATPEEVRDHLMQMDSWRRTREPAAAGDELEKFLTVGGALGSEAFQVVVNQIITGGGAGGGGGPGDLSSPTSITGLTASSAIYNHIVEWDAPTYTQGGGNAYTEVYRAIYSGTGPLPTFANAVQVYAATGSLSIVAIPAQPGEQAHFWAGAVTANGIRQVDTDGPTGGTNGVQTTTGQDVAYLLEVLTGQITDSQLYVALGTPIGRIGSIDDSAAMGNLRAALLVHEEAQARAQAAVLDAQDRAEAIRAEAGQRAQGLLDEARERGTAITQTQQLINDGDTALAQQIVTLTAVVETDRGDTVAAVEQEALARVEGDEAEAALRDLLAVQVRGNYEGEDVGSVTSGLVWSEREARITAIGVQASRTDALELSVDNPTPGLLARADALEATTVSIGNDLAVEADNIDALQVSVDTPASGLLARADALETTTARIEADGEVLAQRASVLEASLDTAGAGLLAWASALDATTANVTSGNAALAQRASRLETEVRDGPNNLMARASITESETAEVKSQASALTLRVDELESTVKTPSTGLLARIVTVEGTVVDLDADIVAVANRTTDLEAVVTDPTEGVEATYAALQTAESVTAALDGSVQALYTVRAEVGSGGSTLVGGFGLSATATAAGGPKIDFGVRADTFWVGAPSGSGTTEEIIPFVIKTSAWDDNGIDRPAGVYIKGAFIENLLAVYATIQSLVADDITAATIRVDQLLGSEMRVGSFIQSIGFVSGSNGWRIQSNGVAEFAAASIRGQLVAAQIDTRGLTIKASDGANIVTAGASVAASTFLGDVTGTVAGMVAATLVTKATDAEADAAQALLDAAAAQGELDDIAADDKLTPAEKEQLFTVWRSVLQGHSDLLDKADAAGVDRSTYATYYGTLNTYLTGASGLLVNRSATSTIVRATFDANWDNVWSSRNSLLNRIAAKAQADADAAQVDATQALLDAADAQADATLALTAKLAKSGADILTGPISLNAASAILVGTVNDGLYLGNTGIVGRKASQTTFSVDQAGNATFAGELSAATGTFAGVLTASAINAVDTINLKDESISSTYTNTWFEYEVTDAGAIQLADDGSLETTLVSFANGKLEFDVTAKLRAQRSSATFERWLEWEAYLEIRTGAGTFVDSSVVSRSTTNSLISGGSSNNFYTFHVTHSFAPGVAGTYKARLKASVICRDTSGAGIARLTTFGVQGYARIVNRKV